MSYRDRRDDGDRLDDDRSSRKTAYDRYDARPRSPPRERSPPRDRDAAPRERSPPRRFDDRGEGGYRGGDYGRDRDAPRGDYGRRDDRPYGGGYGRDAPRNDYGAPRGDYGAPRGDYGRPAAPRDWDREAPAETPKTVEPFEKNFYREHEDVAARSDREVERFIRENHVTVRGSNIPKPVLKFEEAGFHDFMLEALRAAKFEKPTLIQSMAWPIVLSGRDLIGVAETGSGKTISFMLPAMVHLRAQRPLKRGDGPIVLVLAPTRELAVQIDTETKRFASTSKGLVRSVCCYGGQGTKGQQIRALRAGVEIVVATPGRLNDFLNQGIVNLDRVTYLVLDEADRMLDMGFEPQIREIIERIRPDRQTVMFTATWPKDVQQLARDFISEDACQVNVGSLELKANSRVDQRFEFLNNDYEKEAALVRLFREMHMDDGSRVLLFVQRKQAADDLARALQRDGIDALAMHGDKSQPERDRILDEFRRGSHPVLVATDVAARGLDVKNVKYVVNYDMPNNVEDYVHRIGRTARAGAEGVSLSFFTQQNAVLAEDLYNLLRESGAEIPARLHEYVEEARRSRYMKRQRYGQARGYAGRGRGGFGGNRYGSNSGGGRW